PAEDGECAPRLHYGPTPSGAAWPRSTTSRRFSVVSLDCCQNDASCGFYAACGPRAEKSALRQSAERAGIPNIGNSPGTPPDFRRPGIHVMPQPVAVTFGNWLLSREHCEGCRSVLIYVAV